MSREIETYSAKELATKIGIPYRIVLRAIKMKELRCIRFSPKFRRIRSEDAARWVQGLTE